jgi:hypothetical protein
MQKVIMILKKNEELFKITSFILFVVLAFIIGIHHEPWADEAQSWLIARDTRLTKLPLVMAYEGSPALWPIVLKIFIYFGIDYQHLFIIPLIFSSLGIWLLIYKSKLPLGIRIFLPFTYYIFYQYTIVARSYCLVLPCIELIALTYKDRTKKPHFYGILLILLSSISVHMLLLSGILFILYCLDIYGLIKQNENKIIVILNIVIVIIIGASYIFTVWYLRTPSDCSYTAARFNLNIIHIILLFCARIGEVLIFNSLQIYGIVVFMILILLFNLYYKANFKFYIIASVVWIFLSSFFCNKWHIGLIFLSILLALQISSPKRKFTDKRINNCIYLLIGVVFCVQISWSFTAAYYDYNEDYSGSYEAAKFIKENHYENSKIYGLGYYPTAIEPYFNKNIFKNRRNDKAFYVWSFSNGDLTNEEILKDLPYVVVYSEFEQYRYSNIINVLKNKGYKCYSFKGASYIKDSTYESQTFYVWVNQ